MCLPVSGDANEKNLRFLNGNLKRGNFKLNVRVANIHLESIFSNSTTFLSIRPTVLKLSIKDSQSWCLFYYQHKQGPHPLFSPIVSLRSSLSPLTSCLSWDVAPARALGLRLVRVCSLLLWFLTRAPPFSDHVVKDFMIGVRSLRQYHTKFRFAFGLEVSAEQK